MRRVRLAGLVERRDLVEALEATPHEELCAICHDDFHDGVELRLLPCSHAFHCGCIDKWLYDCGTSRPARPVACPLCNAKLDTAKAAAVARARQPPVGVGMAWAWLGNRGHLFH